MKTNHCLKSWSIIIIIIIVLITSNGWPKLNGIFGWSPSIQSMAKIWMLASPWWTAYSLCTSISSTWLAGIFILITTSLFFSFFLNVMHMYLPCLRSLNWPADSKGKLFFHPAPHSEQIIRRLHGKVWAHF